VHALEAKSQTQEIAVPDCWPRLGSGASWILDSWRVACGAVAVVVVVVVVVVVI
jgi:hypothetical protein